MSEALERLRARMDAAHAADSELRRLANVEAELQQAREERTALLVNEQNLREEVERLRASLNTDAQGRR
jgi:chromosome segregation ATPase